MAILRYVSRDVDREQRLLEVVDVLECLDADWKPSAEAKWADRKELSELPLAIGEHREIVQHVLEASERGAVPAARAPWAREGWLAEATAWIDESLAALGRAPSGRVEQLRVWSLSCILRVPTVEGAVFFKATAGSPLFVDEGTVTAGLAALYPASIPAPIAVDGKRRWMLLDDLGAELGWDAPLEVREEVHRLFARMQLDSSRRVDHLLALGCVDRRPIWLAAQLRELLEDEGALARLDEDEAGTFRALGPTLEAMCLRLAESAVPAALAHGDLHLSNVARVNGRYVFFDWTDACITHPFFDLIDVFHERDEGVATRIRDAYLSTWLDFGSMDELLELWKTVVPLAALNQAVSYRHILANVEPGATDELEWALPFFLRKVLAAPALAG